MTRLPRAGSRKAAHILFVAAALGVGCTTVVEEPSPAPTTELTRTVAASAAPTPSPTPTTQPAYWPLTGLRAEDPAAIHRRPLNVRLANDPAARPLVGLSKADLVFDLIVEGGITRFSAIYQSQDAQAVGPVRSYRFSDLHVTQMLRGALVASGATIEEKDAVTSSVAAGNMISVDAQRVGGPYYRVAGRPGPNDLFADLGRARQAVNDAGGKDPVDVPALAFFPSLDHDVKTGGAAAAVAATTAVIPLKDPATFTYDPGSRGYRRTQAGVRTVDLDGNVQILARNVIVIHTDIWETSVIEDIFGSKGLDYRMTGGGPATVFRDGLRIDGTWERDGPLDMFSFSSTSGEQVLLEPGQSWIHFLLPGVTVTSSAE